MKSGRYHKQLSRSRSRRLLGLIALLAYFISGAVVPAGYMAAPLESGTAFHLCPGDARSAVVIGRLSPGAKGHHHHHQGGADSGETAAEPGCVFAGFSSVTAGPAPVLAGLPVPPVPVSTGPPGRESTSPAWLRPPARSPPA